MKRIQQLSIISLNLLTSMISGADMDTLLGAPSWTAEQQALGKELIDAASRDNTTRIEEILTQQPALVNFKDEYSSTALEYAAYWKCTHTIDRLIAAHADIDSKNKYGHTPLIVAAQQSHLEIVNTLIAHQVDIDLQDNEGLTALMWATYMNQTEIVRVLLNARADITLEDTHEETALELAQRRRTTVIVRLLQNHVPIEPEEETIMVKPAVD